MFFIGEADMRDAAGGAASGVGQIQPKVELHFEMERLRLGREARSVIEGGAMHDSIALEGVAAKQAGRRERHYRSSPLPGKHFAVKFCGLTVGGAQAKRRLSPAR